MTLRIGLGTTRRDVARTSCVLLMGLVCTFAASRVAFTQDGTEGFDKYPHVTLTPQINLNGMGYQTVSQALSTGTIYEGRHIALDGQVTYDNKRKVNDGTGPNPHGHTRGMEGTAFVRLPHRWLAGGNVSWGQTSTTNYTKSGWGWSFGGGKDFLRSDVSCRLTALYSLPYSDHTNGLQGLSISFILPSPITRHHVFFTETYGLAIFHDTITDPHDRALTAAQISNRNYGSDLSVGLMFKF
jgi:hypothetical protein